MGAARDGVWPEMQIRQTAEDAGADRALDKLGVVRSGGSSQQSRACAMVVINSSPTQREAYEASNLRDAADRDWPLRICREISLMRNREQLLRIYYYAIQNWIPTVNLGSA